MYVSVEHYAASDMESIKNTGQGTWKSFWMWGKAFPQKIDQRELVYLCSLIKKD